MTPIRRFLIALVLFAVGWYAIGAYALNVDEAVASKTVLAKCARATPSVSYPHWKHTTVACQNPGWWIRVRSKFARRIGTYPIVISEQAFARSVCIDRKPKVTKRIDRNEATSSWVPRRACARQGIA